MKKLLLSACLVGLSITSSFSSEKEDKSLEGIPRYARPVAHSFAVKPEIMSMELVPFPNTVEELDENIFPIVRAFEAHYMRHFEDVIAPSMLTRAMNLQSSDLTPQERVADMLEIGKGIDRIRNSHKILCIAWAVNQTDRLRTLLPKKQC
jgi:hypothetical protein